jgi:hypothetical protein
VDGIPEITQVDGVPPIVKSKADGRDGLTSQYNTSAPELEKEIGVMATVVTYDKFPASAKTGGFGASTAILRLLVTDQFPA